MHKIDKFLQKLTKPEREVIQKILEQIATSDFSTLDLKKMKGDKKLYRVRKGRIRIIFTISNKQILIQSIQFRDDQTYR